MSNPISPISARWRKPALISWLVLWMALLALHLYPIRFASLRLTILGVLLLLWACGWWLFRSNKLGRVLCIISALPLAFGLLPGRPDDPGASQQQYVAALRSYQGAPYVWGGETRRGIDCSGLIRCGLIDTNLTRAFTTLNPALLRTAFSLWWHDSSAHDMGEGYAGRTRLLFIAPNLNHLDYTRVQPGDIAVTASGAHVLAYIGNKTWIEADPNMIAGNQVIEVRVPTHNAWFNLPMRLMRWRQLEPGVAG